VHVVIAFARLEPSGPVFDLFGKLHVDLADADRANFPRAGYCLA
jgi:hypothetical protein